MDATWLRRIDAPIRFLWVIAIASGAAVAGYRYAHVWTPFQRLYLSVYVRTELAGVLFDTGRYRLVEVVTDTHVRRVPLEPEVTPRPAADGTATYAVTPLGTSRGVRAVLWAEDTYNNRALHEYLRQAVYHGQALFDLARPALLTALGVIMAGLLFPMLIEVVRAARRRRTRRTTEPALVTWRRFNRRWRGDSLTLTLVPSGLDRLTRARPILRVALTPNQGHILLIGDSAVDKSTIVRQFLDQIAARGETAIVYDPASEYTGQFYTPARGDVILNPLDARMPYWSPGDEVQDHAETTALAEALCQDFPDNRIALISRGMLARLLMSRPTASELVRWLSNSQDFTQRVADTLYATIAQVSPEDLRSWLVVSLSTVADALDLLPATEQASGRWTASTWAQQRAGWLFLTSTPETHRRLRPLTSVWLDVLLLRLQRPHMVPARRVWLVFDDLASLHRLPQLWPAMTSQRANCPMIIGLQGRRPLDTPYGRNAEMIVSQPETKIFLRTAEGDAAAWIAHAIGKAQTRDRSPRVYADWQPPATDALVTPGEIAGLPDRRVLVKAHHLTVTGEVAADERRDRHPAFIARPLTDRPARPLVRLHETQPLALPQADRTDEGDESPRPHDVEEDLDPLFR